MIPCQTQVLTKCCHGSCVTSTRGTCATSTYTPRTACINTAQKEQHHKRKKTGAWQPSALHAYSTIVIEQIEHNTDLNKKIWTTPKVHRPNLTHLLHYSKADMSIISTGVSQFIQVESSRPDDPQRMDFSMRQSYQVETSQKAPACQNDLVAVNPHFIRIILQVAHTALCIVDAVKRHLSA